MPQVKKWKILRADFQIDRCRWIRLGDSTNIFAEEGQGDSQFPLPKSYSGGIKVR
jgi:hypothetical protein